MQKDDVGVGGSWLDFLNYLVSSVSSSNVKLVLEGPANSDGIAVTQYLCLVLAQLFVV